VSFFSRHLKSYIKRRLHGYREVVNDVDITRPKQLAGHKPVAVIGAGLAGIAATSLLAERGFAVTLFDRNPYLGGKTAGWQVTFADGTTTPVDHGFHAFFRHYYNLQAFLEKIGARRYLSRIDDYLVLGADGRRFGFKDVATTPVLNIISLGLNKFYRFRDVLLNPGSRRMGEFIKYDEIKTYSAWDRVSFAQFAEEAKLPSALSLVFNTFARAFFAPAEKLSSAELMKSFHFFYLSHDHGLLYDYFITDYERAFVQPVSDYLYQRHVRLKLNHPITHTTREAGRFIVGGEFFDAIILACDVRGSREICRNSEWLQRESPSDYDKLINLEASGGYAIYRLWLDRQTDPALPVFVITEKRRVLDSVTFYHRFEANSLEWAKECGGGVYELHCYALPEDIDTEESLQAAFIDELYFYFPALKGARILRGHLQLKRDFTAFHTGLHEHRPSTTTGVANFFLAGDWVKIHTPAMLMEGAFTSGLIAANHLLAQEGLQEEPIHSVPRRGILG
jgi:isorenieratene synthase